MDLQNKIQSTIYDFNLNNIPPQRTAKRIMQLIKDDSEAPKSAAPTGQVNSVVMPILSLAEAPHDELLLLRIPEFATFSESWWPGGWSFVHKKWQLRTPFTIGNKAVMCPDIPDPIGWNYLPKA